MVPHHRVHHRQAVSPEGADQRPRQGHLGLAAHEAGVHAVKGQAQAPPVVHHRPHLVRQVQEGVGPEAAGVGGEVCGGHRAALGAHGGQGGHDDGQRAAAEAAEIVDGGDAGGGHGGLSSLCGDRCKQAYSMLL